MQTRRQDPNQKKFRPDAFASSVEFDRGLLGNQVAARCQKLTDPEEITLLWWIQQISWRDGGLEKFAAAFLAANSSHLGTVSMHKFGMKKGQIYNAHQVKSIRAEMGREDLYPLKGEKSWDHSLASFLELSLKQEFETMERESKFPASYPVEVFLENCRMNPEQLADILKDCAVNPESKPLREALWNLPSLFDLLKAWRDSEVATAKGKIVETQITRTVFEELDFALHSRSFILIEGREGVGKTEAAKNWCAQRPGQAVYIRLESGTDESTLYRSIARAIGTACSYGRKANEMKLRIQDALQPGQVMLVLDEAHFLWPQSERSARSAPKRVDWLRTALIDFGVPVALISTPQYFARACQKFLKGGWNANQIERRLAHTVSLPKEISKAEMAAVVRSYFPKASPKNVVQIALASCSAIGFLTVIQHLRKRVDFVAAKTPAWSEDLCIDHALKDYPAVSASGPTPAPKKDATLSPTTAPAARLKGYVKAIAPAMHPRGNASVSLSQVQPAEPELTVS